MKMDIKQIRKTVGKLAGKQKALIAILFIMILMLFFPTNFYTPFNLIDMVNSSSILMILAFGVTMTVIAGGCDLSIGGVMVTSGIIAIKLMETMNMWLAIIIALVFGMIVGFVNGFLVVQQKTEPFIITLGMGMALTGLAQQLTDARPVTATNMKFMMISNGKVMFGITNLVIIMLVVLGITHLIMRYTQFGRSCYAIGGDYDVARYSGINVVLVKWLTFVISGFTAALAGVLLSSKLNSGSSIYGETTALIVNCAVVVGGVSFAGGVGSIPRAALGLLVFGVLENSMNMLGIQSYVQILTKGMVIVAIIWLDSYARKRKREAV
jgi:ribose/xylose/arabinose/galactoside ABC-type transport system permease subunit